MKPKRIPHLRLLFSAVSFAVAAVFLATSYKRLLPVFDDSELLLNIFITLVSILSIMSFSVWLFVFVRSRQKDGSSRDE